MSQTRLFQVRQIRSVVKSTSDTLVSVATVFKTVIDAVKAEHAEHAPVAEQVLEPTLNGVPTPCVAAAVPACMPALSVNSLKIFDDQLAAISASAPLASSSSQEKIAELVRDALSHAETSVKQQQAIEKLRSFVVSEHQDVVAAEAFAAIRDVCSEINFEPIKLIPESGYILARQGLDGPQLRTDVIKSADGTVAMAIDADCFDGSTCEDAITKIEQRLREKGIELETVARRPKRRTQQSPLRLAIRRGQ